MGWWKLTTTKELNDSDLEYIASQIRAGYTEGEIVEEEDNEDKEEDDEEED